MRLLVDACAGASLATKLHTSGHEVNFVGQWAHDPGDEEILRLGYEQRSVVVTRDKDFGTLAVFRDLPHYGIIRLVELPPDLELALCLKVLETHEAELERGCLITAGPHRIRIREPGAG